MVLIYLSIETPESKESSSMFNLGLYYISLSIYSSLYLPLPHLSHSHSPKMFLPRLVAVALVLLIGSILDIRLISQER